jgi:hypothetical protein
MESAMQITENAIRKRATRAGFLLRKSRAHDWRLDDQGGYMLIDLSSNIVIMGSCFDADLREIAMYLK